MSQTTYGKLSELIITAYYKTERSDNSNYTLRYVAELIAHEVAYFAKADAFAQSGAGETMFANDQFITPYRGLALQTDADGNRYVKMPATPSGLPLNREIERVSFTGNKKLQTFPIRNKDLFMQDFTTTPKWMVLYYIEDGNIVFRNLSALVTAGVDIRLVGAIPAGTELVDCVLNVPKDTESLIFDKVMSRLNSVRGVKVDNTNDNVSQ